MPLPRSSLQLPLFASNFPHWVQSNKKSIAKIAQCLESFTGSVIRPRIIREKDIVNFLSQLRNTSDADILLPYLLETAKRFWTLRRIEIAFTKDLKAKIDFAARTNGAKNIVYAPFGSLRDSSALLFASAFKRFNINASNLEDLLVHSRGASALYNPSETMICWVDDLVQRGVQAEAIIHQYFGIETPREETHVNELPDNLKAVFRRFRHVGFVTLYAPKTGLNVVQEAGQRVGIHLEPLAPANWLEVDTIRGVFDSDPSYRNCLTAVHESYGAQLLKDKFGTKWNDEMRRAEALGYGGIGFMAPFCYQTPTAVPVMLWRFGEVDGKLWRPLLWRESNFERFVESLQLWTHFEVNPEGVYAQYVAFVQACKRTQVELTLDETQRFYKFVEPSYRDAWLQLDAVRARGLVEFWCEKLEHFSDTK